MQRNRRDSAKKELTELRIGKNGMTLEFISEAKEQIEDHGGVRIKLPKGLPPKEKDSMAEELAAQTGSLLEDRRGGIVTLLKK